VTVLPEARVFKESAEQQLRSSFR